MEKPSFININPDEIISSIKTDYEEMTGRTLHPGQVEQLLINAFAYREYLLRTQIQDAATQNLVAFSRAPFLDFLGELVGVRRLLESKAVCPVKMKLIDGHNSLTIPAGIRIQSLDGQAVFTLDEDVNVNSQTDEVIANFTCISPGTIGNAYNAGDIAVILDPQPYLASVENIEPTTGGSNDESDDELRKRIMLAPQSFSNAGSRGAYEYYARSANTGIADVGITSPVPGQVNIYPLMQNGELPNQAVLDEVAAACNDDKIRPLTDTVIVSAPSEVNYNIDVELTIITGEVESEATTAVRKNLETYAESRHKSIGMDVVIEKIISECMKVDHVYSVSVIEPSQTIVVNENEVAFCGNINITVVGYSDE